MSRVIVFAMLAWACISACTHNVELRPAATAQLVPGAKDAASAEVAGVRLIADGSKWRGDPEDLGTMVTPVRITIENGGPVPLRVRYQDFALTTAAGFAARALPPLQIQRPAAVTVAPMYAGEGFYLAPPYAPFYPGLPVWPDAYGLEPYPLDSYYIWQEPLPTRDMLARALPEGVVDSKGRVSGYVYFQAIPAGTNDVSLTFQLVKPHTGEVLGKIAIPFVVKR